MTSTSFVGSHGITSAVPLTQNPTFDENKRNAATIAKPQMNTPIGWTNHMLEARLDVNVSTKMILHSGR